MADWSGIYRTGTATVEQGSLTVTLQGAGNLVQAVRAGDRFGAHRGLLVRIAAVAPGSLTLAAAWPGPSQTAEPYEIAFTPYDSGYREALQILLGGIEIDTDQIAAVLGSMPDIITVGEAAAAIAALAPVADKIAVIDPAAVSLAAEKMPEIEAAAPAAIAVAADKAIVLQAASDAVAAAELVGSYTTLAAANADLANIPANRAVTVTADGANNGLYVKRSGVLVKDSSATVGALDARQKEAIGLRQSPSTLQPLIAIGGDMALWHDGEGFDGIPSPSLKDKLAPDGLGSGETHQSITPLATIGADMAIWHDGEGFTGVPSPDLKDQIAPGLQSKNSQSPVVTPLAVIGADMPVWHDGTGVDMVPSPKLVEKLLGGIPLPERPRVYWPERKRYLQMKLAANKASRTDQLSIAVIGDSWTQQSSGYLQDLRLLFGSAGFDHAAAGWVDWAQDLAGDWAGVSNSRTGTWTINNTTAAGPALAWITAASAAAMTITANVAHSVWRLVYLATGGVGEYSFDGGATWAQITLSGSGVASIDLTPTAPATSLMFRWGSGTVTVAGTDLRRTAKGIVWHKLGRSGSDTAQWTTGVDRAQWVSGLSALAIDAAVIFLGTNDATPGRSPEAYADNLAELVGRIREAKPGTPPLLPGPDIILCPSPECYRPTPIPMTPYLDAALSVADTMDAAVINLQGIFGDPATRRSWFDTNAGGTTNGLHPVRSTSGLILAKAMFDALSAS